MGLRGTNCALDLTCMLLGCLTKLFKQTFDVLVLEAAAAAAVAGVANGAGI